MPIDLFAPQQNETSPQPPTNGPRDLFAAPPATEMSTGADQNANVPASVVSGFANTGANLFEGGVDAVTWLGEKLGAIDPKIAEQMKKQVGEDMDKHFRSSERTPAGDVFNESRMKYPAASAIPQAALEVGLLSKATPPIVKPVSGAGMVPGAVNVAANLGLQSGSGALVGAGLAGGDTKNQDNAAMIGAAIPPLISGLGAGIKSGAQLLSSKFGWADELKNVVAPINKELVMNNQLNTNDKAAASINNFVSKAKEVGDANWQQIKDLPGTITPTKINVKLNTILNNKNLPPEQASIFHQIQEDLNTRVDSMTNALKFKQSLSDYFSKMKGTSSYQDFQDVKKLVNQQIEARAESAGLGKAFKFANQYHKDIIDPLQKNGSFDIAKAFQNKDNDPSTYAKAVTNLVQKSSQSPQKMKAFLLNMDDAGSKIVEQSMIKSSLDDLLQAPEAFDKNKALRLINKNINKFEGVMSADSIKALNGVKKILTQHGATEAKEGLAGATNSSYFQHSLGAVGGGALGSMLGPVGSAVGAVAGIGLAPKLIQFISNSLESPQGMAILRSIGSGKPWTKHLGSILKAASIYNATEDNK